MAKYHVTGRSWVLNSKGSFDLVEEKMFEINAEDTYEAHLYMLHNHPEYAIGCMIVIDDEDYEDDEYSIESNNFETDYPPETYAKRIGSTDLNKMVQYAIRRHEAENTW